MNDKVYNDLFIGTGNSARSIRTEGLMTSLGGGRFQAFSAGSHANGTVRPVRPCQPMTAHWGVPDPAGVEGTDEHKAKDFMDAGVVLKRRIELMLALPLRSLAGLSLQREIDQIGKSGA